MITEFDALVRNLGLTESDWLLYNLDKLSKDYLEAKELLNKLNKLKSTQSQMRDGLSLEEFKQEINLHHMWIGFTLQYCVKFMKTIYKENPEDDSIEEYEYLYAKYREDYNRFIKDITYVVDNVNEFADEYGQAQIEKERALKVKCEIPKELPPPPKFMEVK